jgi:hypothetical protein
MSGLRVGSEKLNPGSLEEHERLVRECLEELALMGFAAWENPRRAVLVNGRWVSLSKAGRGDIHVILPLSIAGGDAKSYGIHGEVEIKTGQSTQAPKQRAHMRMVRNSGGFYFLARSKLEMRKAIIAAGFEPRI